MTPTPLRALPRWARNALLAIALGIAAAAALAPAAVFGQALDKPCLVVALDKLDGHKLYARTVMVAVPWPASGGHVGFILNKPSGVLMSKLFPDHQPSSAIVEGVFIGGPFRTEVIFALAQSEASPGRHAFLVAPGVWAMVQSDEIDAFIERSPNAARYYVGFVRWLRGELAEEVRSGQVMLRQVDPARLFQPDTSKMYEELVTPSRKPRVET